jgi:thymidylate synthase (FAD)
MIEVTYIDHMGSDLSVVNAARVSFGKKSEAHSWKWAEEGIKALKGRPMMPVLSDKDTNLIKYLAEHKHTSPFGHCFATFHVKAPIFCARQLVKHKFLRWNEISRRYVDDKPEFYVPDVWRGKSEDKKQGSEGVVDAIRPSFIRNMMESSQEDYQYLIDKGVCPEQARMILPQSMMTEWYWSGSLDAFSDMCRLRCASDTQEETQCVSQKIALKMGELFPVSWGALVNVNS